MGLYLFVFLLGALSSLAVVFLLLVNFLNTVEQKVQQEYEEAKKAADADIQVLPSTPHTYFPSETFPPSTSFVSPTISPLPLL